MSEKQVMINISKKKLPNDISMNDLLETLNLIHELKIPLMNKIVFTQDDLKKEIKAW